jgi:hypothetical protein
LRVEGEHVPEKAEMSSARDTVLLRLAGHDQEAAVVVSAGVGVVKGVTRGGRRFGKCARRVATVPEYWGRGAEHSPSQSLSIANPS